MKGSTRCHIDEFSGKIILNKTNSVSVKSSWPIFLVMRETAK